MSQLYPLKFNPQYIEKLWGGTKLSKLLNKPFPSNILIGESWEISDVASFPSVVSNGFLAQQTLPGIIKIFKEELVGKKVYARFGNKFPLLIKFIDAKEKLSVQVHPGDSWAKKYHQSLGKNEMWFVVDADHDATTTIGLKKGTSKEEYLKALSQNNIENVLNEIQVQKGDAFHIPTGRVHAIGAGIMIAEIQQTSDVTYRIFDYNRTERDGSLRELHNEMASEVIDFSEIDEVKTAYQLIENKANKLIHTQDFKTNILQISQEIDLDYQNLDSFVIYLCIEGQIRITSKKRSLMISKGESMLIPASVTEVTLSPLTTSKLLEVSM
ncbi:MAG: mannose-6-phosphate isomerase [Flavobacteriaceae bacterium]|nr:MAG: mannose-6-phosphate isomerase [Flavobacteriaceae bacterium]